MDSGHVLCFVPGSQSALRDYGTERVDFAHPNPREVGGCGRILYLAI